MRATTTIEANPSLAAFSPRRSPATHAAVIVLLLSALFAGATLAALHPHPPVDTIQASVEGGL